MLETYEEDQRERARDLLSNQLRSTVASSVLDKKLHERLVAVATGNAPVQEVQAVASDVDAAPDEGLEAVAVPAEDEAEQ